MPEAKTKTFCWLFPLSSPVPPAHPASHPGPRLEALPNLSYCFKPKFTVSVGGQDPLSPASLHPTLRTLGLSRGWRPCSPPLCSCPARGKKSRQRGGGGQPLAPRGVLGPLGGGHGSPLPNPGLLTGGSPDPSLQDQVPHHTGSVDSSEGAGRKVRLSTDPLWGTPT